MPNVLKREHHYENKYNTPPQIQIQNQSFLPGTVVHNHIITTLVMQKNMLTLDQKLTFLTVGHVMLKVHQTSLHSLQQDTKTLEQTKSTST